MSFLSQLKRGFLFNNKTSTDMDHELIYDKKFKEEILKNSITIDFSESLETDCQEIDSELEENKKEDTSNG